MYEYQSFHGYLCTWHYYEYRPGVYWRPAFIRTRTSELPAFRGRPLFGTRRL